jgi:hypothetical protein
MDAVIRLRAAVFAPHRPPRCIASRSGYADYQTRSSGTWYFESA